MMAKNLLGNIEVVRTHVLVLFLIWAKRKRTTKYTAVGCLSVPIITMSLYSCGVSINTLHHIEDTDVGCLLMPSDTRTKFPFFCHFV